MRGCALQSIDRLVQQGAFAGVLEDAIDGIQIRSVDRRSTPERVSFADVPRQRFQIHIVGAPGAASPRGSCD